MVVYDEIWHRAKLVTGEETGPKGFGRSVQWLVEFFYAEDGILVSPWLACLPSVLDILTGMFDRVVLRARHVSWEVHPI